MGKFLEENGLVRDGKPDFERLVVVGKKEGEYKKPLKDFLKGFEKDNNLDKVSGNKAIQSSEKKKEEPVMQGGRK